jgi:hypothetical protein
MNEGAPIEIQFQLGSTRDTAKNTHEAPRPSSGRLPHITRVLALAIHFDNMIRQGDAKDYAHIARLACVSRERVSQVMRLTYLAPDIQMGLLYLPPTTSRRFPITETAMRKIANLLSWDAQRQAWAGLKHRHHLDA